MLPSTTCSLSTLLATLLLVSVLLDFGAINHRAPAGVECGVSQFSVYRPLGGGAVVAAAAAAQITSSEDDLLVDHGSAAEGSNLYPMLIRRQPPPLPTLAAASSGVGGTSISIGDKFPLESISSVAHPHYSANPSQPPHSYPVHSSELPPHFNGQQRRGRRRRLRKKIAQQGFQPAAGIYSTLTADGGLSSPPPSPSVATLNAQLNSSSRPALKESVNLISDIINTELRKSHSIFKQQASDSQSTRPRPGAPAGGGRSRSRSPPPPAPAAAAPPISQQRQQQEQQQEDEIVNQLIETMARSLSDEVEAEEEAAADGSTSTDKNGEEQTTITISPGSSQSDDDEGERLLISELFNNIPNTIVSTTSRTIFGNEIATTTDFNFVPESTLQPTDKNANNLLLLGADLRNSLQQQQQQHDGMAFDSAEEEQRRNPAPAGPITTTLDYDEGGEPALIGYGGAPDLLDYHTTYFPTAPSTTTNTNFEQGEAGAGAAGVVVEDENTTPWIVFDTYLSNSSPSPSKGENSKTGSGSGSGSSSSSSSSKMSMKASVSESTDKSVVPSTTVSTSTTAKTTSAVPPTLPASTHRSPTTATAAAKAAPTEPPPPVIITSTSMSISAGPTSPETFQPNAPTSLVFAKKDLDEPPPLLSRPGGGFKLKIVNSVPDESGGGYPERVHVRDNNELPTTEQVPTEPPLFELFESKEESGEGEGESTTATAGAPPAADLGLGPTTTTKPKPSFVASFADGENSPITSAEIKEILKLLDNQSNSSSSSSAATTTNGTTTSTPTSTTTASSTTTAKTPMDATIQQQQKLFDSMLQTMDIGSGSSKIKIPPPSTEDVLTDEDIHSIYRLIDVQDATTPKQPPPPRSIPTTAAAAVATPSSSTNPPPSVFLQAPAPGPLSAFALGNYASTSASPSLQSMLNQLYSVFIDPIVGSEPEPASEHPQAYRSLSRLPSPPSTHHSRREAKQASLGPDSSAAPPPAATDNLLSTIFNLGSLAFGGSTTEAPPPLEPIIDLGSLFDSFLGGGGGGGAGAEGGPVAPRTTTTTTAPAPISFDFSSLFNNHWFGPPTPATPPPSQSQSSILNTLLFAPSRPPPSSASQSSGPYFWLDMNRFGGGAGPLPAQVRPKFGQRDPFLKVRAIPQPPPQQGPQMPIPLPLRQLPSQHLHQQQSPFKL